MLSVHAFEELCDKTRALISSPRFIVWVIPLIITLRLLSSSPADPDLFARVAMGHLTLSHATVPLTDPFAFTKTLPMWVDHEWLSGVIFYLVASATGDAGLIVLRGILAILATLSVICASTRVTPSFGSRFVWVTMCLLHSAAAWSSAVRCQAFTYLFIPLLYWAIIEYRKSGTAIWLALTPLMGIAWVNMHGGYALGCIIIGLFCVTEAYEKRLTKTPVFVAIGWAIAPLFTPYGFKAFVTFLVGSLGMERPGIAEWEPLHVDQLSFALTILLSLPLAYGMLALRKQRDLFTVGITFLSAYCAFRHIRFLPFFMITAATFGGPYVQATVARLRELRPSLFVALTRSGSCVVLVMCAVGSASLLVRLCSKTSYQLNLSAFPVSAVEWLRDNQVSGRLLVDFNMGSFAMWRLYPNFKISVDGRYEEAYPQETVTQNALAFNPATPEGVAALEKINPTHILVFTPPKMPTAPLSFGDEWKPIYQDSRATILSRDSQGAVATSSNYAETPPDMWEPRF